MKSQREEESMEVGFSRTDSLCQSKEIVGIDRIAIRLRRIWQPSFDEDTTRFKALVSISTYRCQPIIPNVSYMLSTQLTYQSYSLVCLQGLNKPWETNQLSSFHPEVPIHRTRSKSSDQRTLGNSSTHRQESSRFPSYGDRDRPSSPYSDEGESVLFVLFSLESPLGEKTHSRLD